VDEYAVEQGLLCCPCPTDVDQRSVGAWSVSGGLSLASIRAHMSDAGGRRGNRESDDSYFNRIASAAWCPCPTVCHHRSFVQCKAGRNQHNGGCGLRTRKAPAKSAKRPFRHSGHSQPGCPKGRSYASPQSVNRIPMFPPPGEPNHHSSRSHPNLTIKILGLNLLWAMNSPLRLPKSK
jgi:hypothetical protein